MPLGHLPSTTTPYAYFSQSQPKPNSYFRNRFSKGKATTPSHSQAIFTGCLSPASLSLASFLLLAGRLLWRFLKKQREKGIQETQSMEMGMEEIFCVNKSISPKSLPGKPLMKRPDPQTVLLCITSPITWHRDFAVVAAPVNGIPATDDAEQSYTHVCQNTKQLQQAVRKDLKTFFLPFRAVENSLSDHYRLSTLSPRCPCGSQTKRDG